MKNFFKRTALVAGLALVSTAAIAEEYRVGTASVGGAFFPVGQSISNLVNKYAGGDMSMVPVVTGGSVQNPRLLDAGEVEIAITNNNLAKLAVKGLGPYKGSAMDIRAIGALHPSVLHMVVPANSDIQSIEDLKGKRVAVGPAGGGTLGFLNVVLPMHDLSFDDITPSFLSYGDGFSQLSDGNVDAAMALSGFPAGAVMQASASTDLRIIEFSPEKLAEIIDSNSAYGSFEIAADVYGTAEAATVLGVSNMLIVKADADADVIEAITGAIYGHMDEFRAENANAQQIVVESSLDLAIPLHDGAARFFNK